MNETITQVQVIGKDFGIKKPKQCSIEKVAIKKALSLVDKA